MRSTGGSDVSYAIMVSPLLIETGQYRRSSVYWWSMCRILSVVRTAARDQATEEQVRAIIQVEPGGRSACGMRTMSL